MGSRIADENELVSRTATCLPKARQVLVFAPHPDDEVFGCGGALALLRARNVPVSVVIVTDGAAGGGGDPGGLVQIRSRESLAAAALLGLSEPVFWGYPDRGLAYGEKLIEKVMEAISRLDADLVFLPSPTELHPDHQALAFAGAEALRRLGGVRRAAFYEINLPLPNPNLFIDISPVVQQKTAAMRCFPSQLQEQPYDQRVEGLNRFRSYFLGSAVSHAEAFLLVEASRLMPGLSSLFEGPLAHRQRLGFAVSGVDLPLVSIIVRSMNRPVLSRALDSVALQTWSNVEVVVVNARGGEHAWLPEQCGPFPLRLINQDGEKLPRSQAANCGLLACRGVYLTFLDDDDTIDPDHIKYLVDALKNHNGTAVAYTGVRGVNEQSPREPIIEFREPDVDFARLLMGNILPIHGVLFPAALVQAGARFDETLDLYEDWDFWLQLSRQAPFVFVDRISATYYADGGSGVGFATTADEDIKRLANEAVAARWLARLTPQEFCAITERYYRLKGRFHQADAERNAFEKGVAERDACLAERDSWLAERDSHIANLERVRAEQAAHFTQALAVRDAELAALYTSRSWRVTAPLRWSGRQLRRLRRLLRAVPLSVEQGGGLAGTITKAVRVVRREGLSGVRRKIRFVLEKEAWTRAVASGTGTGKTGPAGKHTPLQTHQQMVDIVICIHNALADVKRCLTSVLCSTAPPYRLILVDDGSADETRDYLKRFAAGQGCVLLRHETALGYTCAANAGLQASSAPFVLLLNSDTMVAPRWLDRLICCAESAPRLGMVGPLSNTASWQSVPAVFDAAGDWAENPLPPGWDLNRYAGEVARESARIYPRVGFLNGFCLLIKRELIREIGLFDAETFGRGYGEENDYCLRATAARWELALADDCYVFHAQSKSYSSERRQKLAQLAGLALSAKHGDAPIEAGLAITRHHPALEYIRQRCSSIPLLTARRAELLRHHEGRRLLFLLPAGTAGGGGTIVLLECSIMRRMGVDAWIANLQAHQMLFEQFHPNLDVPVLYLKTPADLSNHAHRFDAVIATLHLTVSWLEPLRSLPVPPRLGYYIQDYEPDFYLPGTPEYRQAFASYTALPELVLVTKTRWNADMVQRHTGAVPTVIGASFDLDTHCPSPSAQAQGEGSVQIVAMVRPSTPRRAPQTTMRVLKQLKERFREQIEITIFGVATDHPEYLKLERDFPHQSLGELQMGEVRQLMARSDIFVDCSTFQAMGLTAMEAMASGVAVVGPVRGGLAEIIRHGHNGLLVDTSEQQAVVEAVDRLVRDPGLRHSIGMAGLEVVACHPLLSSGRLLDTLFPPEHDNGEEQA